MQFLRNYFNILLTGFCAINGFNSFTCKFSHKLAVLSPLSFVKPLT